MDGGAGFLGSALVHALVARGDDVRVLDDCSRGSRSRLDDLKGQVHFIKGDIRNPLYTKWAVKDRDCVIHMAAINGTKNFYERPYDVLTVGVKGMTNILDACQEYGVKEFMLVSSSEVYQTPPVIPTPETVPLSVPDPLCPRYSYGGSKIISELLALWFPWFERVLVARPHNVFGPWAGSDHVIPQLIERILALQQGEELKIDGTGEETRAFCHIDDCVSGLLTILDKGEHRGVYNIGSSEETRIWQLAQYLLGLAGKGPMIDYAAASPEGSTQRRCPDVSKLTALGWKPQVELSHGLWGVLQWHKEQMGC